MMPNRFNTEIIYNSHRTCKDTKKRINAMLIFIHPRTKIPIQQCPLTIRAKNNIFFNS